MDRSYKEDIPKYRAALTAMKAEFEALALDTDWTGLRIEPLLNHVERLDQLLRSRKFARETARSRKGVAMFHADLVYLRTNLKELRAILSDARQKLDRGLARAGRGKPSRSLRPTDR